MPSKTIAIASDHAGYDLKTILKQELTDQGYSVLDLGANGPDSVDYPDFAYAQHEWDESQHLAHENTWEAETDAGKEGVERQKTARASGKVSAG